MAEFWGNNQPTALPTGHRPPCTARKCVWWLLQLQDAGGDGDWGQVADPRHLASAKHLPWYGKVNGRGNPLGLASLDHHWAVADAGSTCTPAGED